MPFQPGQQCRAEIETYLRVVVNYVDNLSVGAQYPRGGVSPVALLRYLVVPVMIGIGRVLQLHLFQPRVLPRRLIKMTMNTNVVLHLQTSCLRYHEGKFPPSFTIGAPAFSAPFWRQGLALSLIMISVKHNAGK